MASWVITRPSPGNRHRYPQSLAIAYHNRAMIHGIGSAAAAVDNSSRHLDAPHRAVEEKALCGCDHCSRRPKGSTQTQLARGLTSGYSPFRFSLIPWVFGDWARRDDLRAQLMDGGSSRSTLITSPGSSRVFSSAGRLVAFPPCVRTIRNEYSLASPLDKRRTAIVGAVTSASTINFRVVSIRLRLSSSSSRVCCISALSFTRRSLCSSEVLCSSWAMFCRARRIRA